MKQYNFWQKILTEALNNLTRVDMPQKQHRASYIYQ